MAILSVLMTIDDQELRTAVVHALRSSGVSLALVEEDRRAGRRYAPIYGSP